METEAEPARLIRSWTQLTGQESRFRRFARRNNFKHNLSGQS